MTVAMTDLMFAWEWAAQVDGRFTQLRGDLFCADPDHDRKGLEDGMSGMVAWIRDHWGCWDRITTLPTAEPTAEPALFRPYLIADGTAPAVGVVRTDQPVYTEPGRAYDIGFERAEPAFTDPPPLPCPFTGLADCADRDCELHYTLAPLNLEPRRSV
jgi:hypothetical protein